MYAYTCTGEELDVERGLVTKIVFSKIIELSLHPHIDQVFLHIYK